MLLGAIGYMNKLLMAMVIVLGYNMSANAQIQSSDNYQQYRQQLMNDYQGFRRSVLDNYADYLNAVWKDFQSFKGVKRDETPKPITPPNVQNTPADKPSDNKPILKVPEPSMPVVPTKPALPSPPVEPASPVVPQMHPDIPFSFYGVALKAPKLQCQSLYDTKSQTVSQTWKQYEKSNMKSVAKTLLNSANSMGLNDWFTYEMVRLCVDSQCKQMTANERVVLKHYLLANMGYDVRLAMQTNQFILLVGIAEQVYARRFANINGHRYYLFADDNSDSTGEDHFTTCDLPGDINLGSPLSMKIKNSLKFSSGEKQSVRISWKDMEVTCEVDVKEMEMLRHYPQMDIPMYANSVVDSSLRESMLRQIEPYIKGLPERDAANKLLYFVQQAFAYATDGEQHGYEKAYFLEENFYYPKNDCEDRAIFYAFLVRNLLGLDVHLVQFPGHECTAVRFTDKSISGDGYIYGDKTFVICDPTYIGASIGECMPAYRTISPKIQIW